MIATLSVQEEAAAAALPFLGGSAHWQSRNTEDWQTAVAPVDSAEPLSWGRMLEINSTLPPLLKFALDPGLKSELRAEKHRDESGGIIPDIAAPVEESQRFDKDTLVALCREAGWQPMVRAQGEAVTIPLEPGLLVGPARLVTGDLGWRVVLEIESASQETETVRAARELLLLRLNHHVRLVRALRRPTETGLVTELETGFCAMPPAEQVGHALCALTVAAQCCAAVFEGLANEDLARAYLATMGSAAPAADA